MKEVPPVPTPSGTPAACCEAKGQQWKSYERLIANIQNSISDHTLHPRSANMSIHQSVGNPTTPADAQVSTIVLNCSRLPRFEVKLKLTGW